MTAMAVHSRTTTTSLFREGARNMTTPRRQKRKPAMGAGRPGNKALVGRWEGKTSLSNGLEPTPAKYSVQTTAPMANANRAPLRRYAPFPLDEYIHRDHPAARYANEDHGAMRVGLATWPAAKSTRKASAV